MKGDFTPEEGIEVDACWGPGTTPEGVKAAVIEQVAGARISMPPPTTSEVERFFGDMAEQVKRAGGAP